MSLISGLASSFGINSGADVGKLIGSALKNAVPSGSQPVQQQGVNTTSAAFNQPMGFVQQNVMGLPLPVVLVVGAVLAFFGFKMISGNRKR